MRFPASILVLMALFPVSHAKHDDPMAVMKTEFLEKLLDETLWDTFERVSATDMVRW